MILHALDAALILWGEATSDDLLPLSESYWHVGDIYRDTKEQLRVHIDGKLATTRDGQTDVVGSECEKLFHQYPRICRVAMHAFGEWTPRAKPEVSSLRSIIHPSHTGYSPRLNVEPEYDGIDVLPYSQRIPDGEVDVHAIAIASTKPPLLLNHTWVDDADQRRLFKIARKVLKSSAVGSNTDKQNKTLRNVAHGEQDVASQRPSPNNDHNDEVIIPGSGWILSNAPTGFCDGSSMSSCNRNKGSNCLMYGHNDKRAGILGDALSGWLVFTVPKVKEGIILLRMEWWVDANSDVQTEGWAEINNSKTNASVVPDKSEDTNVRGRTLRSDHSDIYFTEDSAKPSMRRLVGQMPDDMKFDIAMNGKIRHTMKKDEFMSWGKEHIKNFALWPILDDVEWAKDDKGNGDGEDVEVGVRLRSAMGREATMRISHVYYA